MKRILILSVVLFQFKILAFAQNSGYIPEFENQLYFVDSLHGGLIELETTKTKMKYKQNLIGSKSSFLLVVDKDKSKTRVKKSDRLSFAITRADQSADLSGTFSLHKAQIKKGDRETLFMGNSGGNTTGDKDVIQFKVKRISGNTFYLVAENLEKGEYLFVNLASPVGTNGSYTVLSFGVE